MFILESERWVDACTDCSALQPTKWIFRRISYQDLVWPETVLIMPAGLLPVCYFAVIALSRAALLVKRQEKVEVGA